MFLHVGMNQVSNSVKSSVPSPSVSACAISLSASISCCCGDIFTTSFVLRKLCSTHLARLVTSSRSRFPLLSVSISSNFLRARANSSSRADSSAASFAAWTAALCDAVILRLPPGDFAGVATTALLAVVVISSRLLLSESRPC